MKHGVCRFCHSETKLAKSHIIPKLLIKPLKKDGKLLSITGEGRYGLELIQDGVKEQLFCLKCEAFFCDAYEKPFLKDWPAFCPPDPWPPGVLSIKRKVEYRSFKLFHLLNLFRASVSTLAEFAQVNLGPHEEKIRLMLMDRDPGPEDLYTVTAMAVYSPDDRALAKVVAGPILRRNGCRTAYELIYAGATWMILVSQGGAPASRKAALKEDGSITISSTPWQYLSALQDASLALQGKAERPS